MCAIFCLVHGSKNDGRALISWEQLREHMGESWETYAHELMVNGMLHGGLGYFYLTDEWMAMTRAEGMEKINQMYPRNLIRY